MKRCLRRMGLSSEQPISGTKSSWVHCAVLGQPEEGGEAGAARGDGRPGGLSASFGLAFVTGSRARPGQGPSGAAKRVVLSWWVRIGPLWKTYLTVENKHNFYYRNGSPNNCCAILYMQPKYPPHAAEKSPTVQPKDSRLASRKIHLLEPKDFRSVFDTSEITYPFRKSLIYFGNRLSISETEWHLMEPKDSPRI